jgi:hypothetical protein
MNWEAIGALGEVGSTVAVVVTLVFLYRQMKLSSDITRTQIDTMEEHPLDFRVAKATNWRLP